VELEVEKLMKANKMRIYVASLYRICKDLADKIQTCGGKMETNSMNGVIFLMDGDVHKFVCPTCLGYMHFPHV
jgi:hypothetical protein